MMEPVEKNPYDAALAPQRYFEYMDKMRLARIEELEAAVDHLGATIAHLELDIKSWRDKALFNSKWKNTTAEFRIVAITLAIIALVGYGLYRKFDNMDMESVRMPCPITKIVGQ